MTMTHDEYIEKNRKRAVEIALSMIDGSIDYLEGAQELSDLRFEVGLPDDDEDFRAFTGVMSETDHLPIGKFRKNWSESALQKHEPDLKKAASWARDNSLVNCKSIVERFRA